MRYRPQRGSLAESMREVVEVKDGAELLAVLQRQLAPMVVKEYAIYPYGYDKRIGWTTWVVVVDGAAVGFTDAGLDGRRG